MAAFAIAICLLTFDICGARAADAPAAKPAAAPAGKHDTHAPIDVTSDQLDVFQDKNQAVFTGHVIAIQQEMRLKADVMVVDYRKPEDKTVDNAAKKPKAPATPVDPNAPKTPDQSAIKKIDATGNVFLSTPTETASGDTGTYNVENQEIDLNDHVILTRGKNVLKGDHLVYDLNTGKSVLTSNIVPPDVNTPWRGPQKTRVHALFVPDKEKDQKDSAKQPAKPQTPPTDNTLDNKQP